MPWHMPPLPRRRAGAIWAGVLAVLGLAAGSAPAATVTVFDHSGRAHVVENRFLTGAAANPNLPAPPPSAETPAATAAASIARAPRAAAGRHRRPPAPQVTFGSVLRRLGRTGAVPAATAAGALRSWRQALDEETSLSGWRAAQLGDVIATLDEMAALGRVTAARLPVLLLTLADNAAYWRSGPPLADGAAVQFQGSELVWEYYAGAGIQLQVLHTFGEGDGYYEAGPADYGKLVTLMREMVPLAVPRGGGLAWEYYFNWEGGTPPWVSAMAQATGLEALTNAYLATRDPRYLTDAHRALPLLQAPPPAGVAEPTPLGDRFLQYSFTPQTDIINAFLQTLLGLYDYAQVSRDPVAEALYAAGNRQAQAELASFVVPGWSLYQPGQPDPLNYHQLVTGFLRLLCAKTQTPVYCSTYQSFTADLLTAPQLTLLTTQVAAGRRFALRFALSKYAAVGVSLRRAGRAYLYTRQSFFAGAASFAGPRLAPGAYQLRLAVTDPAGHYAALNTTLQVCRGGCPAPPSPVAPPSTGPVPTVTVPLPPPSTSTTTGTTTGPSPTPTTGTTTTPTGTTTTGTSPTGGGAGGLGTGTGGTGTGTGTGGTGTGTGGIGL